MFTTVVVVVAVLRFYATQRPFFFACFHSILFHFASAKHLLVELIAYVFMYVWILQVKNIQSKNIIFGLVNIVLCIYIINISASTFKSVCSSSCERFCLHYTNIILCFDNFSFNFQWFESNQMTKNFWESFSFVSMWTEKKSRINRLQCVCVCMVYWNYCACAFIWNRLFLENFEWNIECSTRIDLCDFLNELEFSKKNCR